MAAQGTWWSRNGLTIVRPDSSAMTRGRSASTYTSPVIATSIAETTIANRADAPWITKSATLTITKATQTHHRITGGASRKTSWFGSGDLTGCQAIRTLGSSTA